MIVLVVPPPPVLVLPPPQPAMPTTSSTNATSPIGQGNVRMSPLAMAMVAATIDSGSWHAPRVIADAAGPPSGPGIALAHNTMTAVAGLMRSAVSSGAAHAAQRSGAPVYGQVGGSHSGSGWTSWFVGYRGDVAFTVIQSGKTAQLSAAALAGAFLSAFRS